MQDHYASRRARLAIWANRLVWVEPMCGRLSRPPRADSRTATTTFYWYLVVTIRLCQWPTITTLATGSVVRNWTPCLPESRTKQCAVSVSSHNRFVLTYINTNLDVVAATMQPFSIYYRTNSDETRTVAADLSGVGNQGFCLNFQMSPS